MKPLNLEEMKKFAPNEVAKADVDMIVRALYKEKQVDTEEEAIEIVNNLIDEIVDDAKQRIKSACEFYLQELENLTSWDATYQDYLISIHDVRKLFRLAFKDVFDEKERE